MREEGKVDGSVIASSRTTSLMAQRSDCWSHSGSCSRFSGITLLEKVIEAKVPDSTALVFVRHMLNGRLGVRTYGPGPVD